MPPTYAEFKTLIGESVGRTHVPAYETALGMIKTAAVSFDHLTNDPHWDRFLSYVQAKLDDAKKLRMESLEACGHVSAEGPLRQAQFQFNRHDAVVKALEDLIGLPIQLKQSYQEIKEK
jgi:hypothetical protein